MADPIEIIDGADLTSYLGDIPVPANLDQLVMLANGIVTDAWATPVNLAPYWVKALTLEVAARPARNPKGLASWTRSVDDASRTERLPDTAARAGVFLTDEEKQRLAGTPRRRRSRYGTIRVRQGF